MTFVNPKVEQKQKGKSAKNIVVEPSPAQIYEEYRPLTLQGGSIRRHDLRRSADAVEFATL
jgi:hypothetical protein